MLGGEEGILTKQKISGDQCTSVVFVFSIVGYEKE